MGLKCSAPEFLVPTSFLKFMGIGAAVPLSFSSHQHPRRRQPRGSRPDENGGLGPPPVPDGARQKAGEDGCQGGRGGIDAQPKVTGGPGADMTQPAGEVKCHPSSQRVYGPLGLIREYHSIAEQKDIYHSLPNIEDMDIVAEVVEMKQMLIDISRKIDDVLDESMTAALMKLSEESILELYENEPDIYSVADLKVRYK
jgi:hypothetical protein